MKPAPRQRHRRAEAAKPVYHVHPQVAWVVETSGIQLIQRHHDAVCFLTYPEAAIWDLFSRGVSGRRLVRLTGAITGLTEEAAAALIGQSLEAWRAAGFVVKETGHG